MISDALSQLADVFLTDAARGNPMSPVKCAAMAAALLDLAERAAAMEAQPIPPAKRRPLRPRRPRSLPPMGIAQ